MTTREEATAAALAPDGPAAGASAPLAATRERPCGRDPDAGRSPRSSSPVSEVGVLHVSFPPRAPHHAPVIFTNSPPVAPRAVPTPRWDPARPGDVDLTGVGTSASAIVELVFVVQTCCPWP